MKNGFWCFSLSVFFNFKLIVNFYVCIGWFASPDSLRYGFGIQVFTLRRLFIISTKEIYAIRLLFYIGLDVLCDANILIVLYGASVVYKSEEVNQTSSANGKVSADNMKEHVFSEQNATRLILLQNGLGADGLCYYFFSANASTSLSWICVTYSVGACNGSTFHVARMCMHGVQYTDRKNSIVFFVPGQSFCG